MRKNDIISIAILGDSAKIHTGFGTVNERIAMGFHEAGFMVHMLGFLDHEHDYKHELPYYFYPTLPMDDLAHDNYGTFLRKIKPDLIYILTDPGNLHHYLSGIIYKEQATYFVDGKPYIPPVIAYVPIEAEPQQQAYGQAFEWVQQTGGRVVAYTEYGKTVIEKQFYNIRPEVIPHGLDHAPFRRYSPEERKALRKLAGLDDFFLIGMGGINKRTKGFVELIYTAKVLREMGQDEGIKFYCHTNPHQATMEGYPLEDLTEYYGVDDMFLWRQVFHIENYWLGIERENGSVENIEKMAEQVPDNPNKRGFLFAHYDFVSMLNTFDLYLDLSRNEGWGLWPGEAMACGVPTMIVNDYGNRSEIYRSENWDWFIEPLPKPQWETWHTGMRLVTYDPAKVALEIIAARERPKQLEYMGIEGQHVTGKYKWADAQQKFVELAKRIVQEVWE